MPNTNCLAGFRCPKCGYEDEFKIAITILADVTDDGTDAYGDSEWTNESFCACKKCHHEGTVEDFQIVTQEMILALNTPRDELPLLIGTLTTDAAKEVLEGRMK